MSQILRDLNKLAADIGAPVVGRNISEQVRALSTYFEGTSHGANIAERINELRKTGLDGAGGGGGGEGDVSSLRLYNRALTDEEISTNHEVDSKLFGN